MKDLEFVEWGSSLTQFINCFGHHLQLLRSNIRGKRVTKVEQNPFTTKVFLCDYVIFCANKGKRTSDNRTFDSCIRTASTTAVAVAACLTCKSRSMKDLIFIDPMCQTPSSKVYNTFWNCSPFIVVMKKGDKSSKPKQNCWLKMQKKKGNIRSNWINHFPKI